MASILCILAWLDKALKTDDSVALSMHNIIIIFFQISHRYFLDELTMLSVGIPAVYTGAAPPSRHTAVASASSAAHATPKAETAARSTSSSLGAGTVA